MKKKRASYKSHPSAIACHKKLNNIPKTNNNSYHVSRTFPSTCNICILVAWSSFNLSITFTATFSPVNTCLSEWLLLLSVNLKVQPTDGTWRA